MEQFKKLGKVFDLNRPGNMWLIDKVFQKVGERDRGVDRETTGFGKMISGLLKPFFLTPAEGAAAAICLAAEEAVSHISRGYFYKCRIAKSSNLPRSG